MKKFSAVLGSVILVALPAVALAQQPRPGDVQTIDGIIKAFYEVVCVPVGGFPDFKRDSSLHSRTAQIRFSRSGREGEPRIEVMTLGELHKLSSAPATEAMCEREVHREVQQFGRIAHVWSTYVMSIKPGGPALKRGISSVALTFDGRRWWINDWTDEEESSTRRIPGAYLPRTRR